MSLDYLPTGIAKFTVFIGYLLATITLFAVITLVCVCIFDSLNRTSRD